MGIRLALEYQDKFRVDASYGDVYALLSNIPEILLLHPNTETVERVDSDIYRVFMRRMGTAKHYFQFSYTSLYDSSMEDGFVRWRPYSSEERLQIDGKFRLLSKTDSVTEVRIDVQGSMELALPRLMQGMVQKFIKEDNEKAWGSFTKNVKEYFSN